MMPFQEKARDRSVNSLIDIAEIHAQPITTAASKARMTTTAMTPALLDPTAMPAKAAKKITPVASE